jgi:hypothetical protein
LFNMRSQQSRSIEKFVRVYDTLTLYLKDHAPSSLSRIVEFSNWSLMT